MTCPGSNASDDNDKNEGSAQLQDVEWLTSLSEPEMDFLVSLKELAIRRAKNAGYKVLADKFDLRMLRALSFILLDFFKEKARSSSEIAGSDEILRRTRMWAGLCEETPKCKKRLKTAYAEK